MGDVCRVREGHTSECVEVQPSLGPGSTKMAFLRLSAKIAGEVTISALQPQSRHGRTRLSSSKSTPREYDSTGITLIALSGVPEIVAMSQFNSRQEVPLEVTLKAGVEYLVVLRSTPRPSENTPSACNICTYAPHPLGLKVSSQTDYGVLFSCLERKALQNGDILWQEGSAFVRCWTSENGEFFVVAFDSGRQKLLACFEWTITNMLWQESSTMMPDPGVLGAAASGVPYTREQVVELQPGQRRTTVLSWVQPRKSYHLSYSYCCGSKACCSVCGAPVGVSVTGRFSGDYFTLQPPSMIGAALKAAGVSQAKYVHAECKTMEKLSEATM